jgi:hypothetical protein
LTFLYSQFDSVGHEQETAHQSFQRTANPLGGGTKIGIDVDEFGQQYKQLSRDMSPLAGIVQSWCRHESGLVSISNI